MSSGSGPAGASEPAAASAATSRFASRRKFASGARSSPARPAGRRPSAAGRCGTPCRARAPRSPAGRAEDDGRGVDSQRLAHQATSANRRSRRTKNSTPDTSRVPLQRGPDPEKVPRHVRPHPARGPDALTHADHRVQRPEPVPAVIHDRDRVHDRAGNTSACGSRTATPWLMSRNCTLRAVAQQLAPTAVASTTPKSRGRARAYAVGAYPNQSMNRAVIPPIARATGNCPATAASGRIRRGEVDLGDQVRVAREAPRPRAHGPSAEEPPRQQPADDPQRVRRPAVAHHLQGLAEDERIDADHHQRLQHRPPEAEPALRVFGPQAAEDQEPEQVAVGEQFPPVRRPPPGAGLDDGDFVGRRRVQGRGQLRLQPRGPGAGGGAVGGRDGDGQKRGGAGARRNGVGRSGLAPRVRRGEPRPGAVAGRGVGDRIGRRPPVPFARRPSRPPGPAAFPPRRPLCPSPPRPPWPPPPVRRREFRPSRNARRGGSSTGG